MVVDDTRALEAFGCDLGRVERLENIEVDDVVLDAERVREAPKLGNPLRQRQLTTLETRLDSVPGLGPLGTPAGGLPALAGDAPGDSSLLLVRALGRNQIVDLHLPASSPVSTSVTSTR